jgi:ATPase
MPVKEVIAEKPVWRLAAQALEYELRRVIRGPFTVEIRSDTQATIYVDEDQIPIILGRGGSRIRELEAELGIGLDVRSYDEMETTPPSRRRYRSERPTRDLGPRPKPPRAQY